MRRIIRRREIVADELRYEGEERGPGTYAVQTLSEWLAAPAAPRATPGMAAVLLRAPDEVEALTPRLEQVRWIVVEFAKTGEGRGFSQARLLRQRYRYQGELRARGAIGRDQLFFLARCGFDAFDLDPSEDLQAALAAFDSFSVAYQGGSEGVVHVHERAPGA
jgi:uncharacterized protein (DUF934 family)